MEFFRIKKDIPFMRFALIFNIISIATFLIAVGALIGKGLNFGVEFTGGTVMEVSYSGPADLGKSGLNWNRWRSLILSCKALETRKQS